MGSWLIPIHAFRSNSAVTWDQLLETGATPGTDEPHGLIDRPTCPTLP